MNIYKAEAWQFYQDDKWQLGTEANNHRYNTEQAGFKVRSLVKASDLLDMAYRVTELEALIFEADKYLETNNLTQISSGSILHNKFKEG